MKRTILATILAPCLALAQDFYSQYIIISPRVTSNGTYVEVSTPLQQITAFIVEVRYSDGSVERKSMERDRTTTRPAAIFFPRPKDKRTTIVRAEGLTTYISFGVQVHDNN